MPNEKKLAEFFKANPGFGISPHFAGTLARLICQEFSVGVKGVNEKPFTQHRVTGFNPDDTTK